jgi:hypothetical protein
VSRRPGAFIPSSSSSSSSSSLSVSLSLPPIQEFSTLSPRHWCGTVLASTSSSSAIAPLDGTFHPPSQYSGRILPWCDNERNDRYLARGGVDSPFPRRRVSVRTLSCTQASECMCGRDRAPPTKLPPTGA